MREWLRYHGRALLLLPWVGLILGMLVSGAYKNYVATWHIYLQILALALLGFTFIGELIGQSLKRVAQQAHGPDCGHTHQSQPAPLSKTLILAHLVPLVLFLAVGPPTLGLQPNSGDRLAAFNGKTAAPEEKPGSQRFTPDGYLITDILKIIRGANKPDSLPSKVSLVGQLYVMPPDNMGNIPPKLREKGVKSFLYRFLMTCCAADARPISVALINLGTLQAERKSWFEVKGQPVIIEDNKKKYVAFQVHSVKQVPRPKEPYLMVTF